MSQIYVVDPGAAFGLPLNITDPTEIIGATEHAVVVGVASGALKSLPVGQGGELLIGATGADPAWTSLTSAGGTIVFTPGANSLNLEAAATVPTTFVADAGSASPAGNILNLLGGTRASTVGAGSTVIINVDDSGLASSFIADVGTATPSGVGALGILGGLNINTAAAGSSVTVNLDDPGEGVVQSDNTGVLSASKGNNGEIIIGSTGNTPAWANITSSDASVTITNAPNSIDLSAPGGITQEIGSFTPTLSFGGASVGMTYNKQVGNYVKIGNLCWIFIDIDIANKGSSTGNAVVSTLPFASVVNGTNFYTLPTLLVTLNANYNMVNATIDTGVSVDEILLWQSSHTGSVMISTTHANYNNGSHFQLNGVYQV